MDDKIEWTVKKNIPASNLERIKEIAEKSRKSDKAPQIDKEVVIGFNANQFIVRLPSELSSALGLIAEKAREKKYKIKFVMDDVKNPETTKEYEGKFLVKKDE